jgi:hypothetical protein
MTTAIAIEPQLIRDPRTADVAKWFAEHRASFTEYGPDVQTEWFLKTLYWAKPGTGMYSIRYVIMGPVLMVWGDLESAVYRWSSSISWEFLAGCDLQYFVGKCEASPKGRDYEEYDRDEWLPGLGKRTAQTCLAHLLGIKMAVAQLTKKEPT